MSGKKRVTTSDARYTLRDSAADADGSMRVVRVKVNKGSLRNARGGAKWNFIKPGRNVILVRTIDSDGAVSPTAKVVVIRR